MARTDVLHEITIQVKIQKRWLGDENKFDREL